MPSENQRLPQPLLFVVIQFYLTDKVTDTVTLNGFVVALRAFVVTVYVKRLPFKYAI